VNGHNRLKSFYWLLYQSLFEEKAMGQKKKLAFLYIFTFQWSTKVAYHLIKKGEQEEEEEEEVKENKVRTALMIK